MEPRKDSAAPTVGDGAAAQAPGNGLDAAIIPADRSPLRQALDDAIAEADGYKLSMDDLTVLSFQVDPFRLDTPANHKLAAWLADTVTRLGLGDRRIHNRGMHYMILGQPK